MNEVKPFKLVFLLQVPDKTASSIFSVRRPPSVERDFVE